MYHCHVSADDLQRIRLQRYRHPDTVVRKRMTILWHQHQGHSYREIAALSDVAPNTVTATIRLYAEKGLDGIEHRQFNHPVSQIEPYRRQLISHFSMHPPRTLKEAGADIQRITGLSFSISHVRNLLLSMGLSRKKLEAFQGN